MGPGSDGRHVAFGEPRHRVTGEQNLMMDPVYHVMSFEFEILNLNFEAPCSFHFGSVLPRTTYCNARHLIGMLLVREHLN